MPSTGVSFLVPTFNRSHYLERNFRHLKPLLDNRECEVLVLDGSTDDKHRKKNEDLCRVAGFDYRFYPSNEYTGYHRMIEALDRRAYPLVQLLPDDDFVNVQGVYELAEIVSADPSLVSAYGDYVNFVVKEDESELMIWSFPDLSARDYVQDSPIDRLFWTMNEGPITSFYGVMRGDALQAALRGVVDVIEHYEEQLFDFSFGDPLLVCLLLAQGKMRHCSLPYFGKELGQSIAKFVSMPGVEIFSNQSFVKKYEKLRGKVLEFFPPDMPEANAIAAIDAAWHSFLGGFSLSGYNTWHGLQASRMELGLPYETIPALEIPPQNVPGLAAAYWARYSYFADYLCGVHSLENIEVIEEWGYPHIEARRTIPAAALAMASSFPEIAAMVGDPVIPRFSEKSSVGKVRSLNVNAEGRVSL